MNELNLQGDWAFKPDPDNVGLDAHWYDPNHIFEDRIKLPGTTDEHGYGERSAQADSLRLNRKHSYIGVAWYRKVVDIPDEWRDKRVTMCMERCLWETKVWVDGQYFGREDSLSAPHLHELPGLRPGRHVITVRIDSSAQVDLGLWSHGWSEEVQTIWNGMIGRITLAATGQVYIKRVSVFPDIGNRSAVVRTEIVNRAGGSWTGSLALEAGLRGEAESQHAQTPVAIEEASTTVESVLSFNEDVALWNEFEPRLYDLKATLSVARADGERGAEEVHVAEETFGMREFAADGPRFRLNDSYVFLRGTHDAGNFPLTGYPSMDKADWLRIYRIAKSYGLNHFRFHSWCPPEAAFAAADEEGVILQAELPLFGIGAVPLGEDPERDAFLEKELERILQTYGNHPSFCMMCMGNELRGDYRILSRFALEGKKKDPRRLYSTVANNASEPNMGIVPVPGDEFYVAHEAVVDGERHVRRGEHLFKRFPPETGGDYAYTLSGIDMPTVSHEVGQWAVYPDYREIAKYTGVLEARNLEKFRDSLEASGMVNEADTFHAASGALSVLLYREEIERSLRTPRYGGFQLLDIHDYPGQGTSLVGWLDAFWDSKGLIEPERFRRFCDAVVVLLRFPKRVYSNNEELAASIDISNYGRGDLRDEAAEWVVRDGAGVEIGRGSLGSVGCAQGDVANIGQLRCPLGQVERAAKLNIEVSILGRGIANDWDIWVYPTEGDKEQDSEDIRIVASWSDELEDYLEKGGQALLLAHTSGKSEATAFTPPFWNTQLFPNQPKTMGLTSNSGHPAFAQFPHDGHTDWQWWDVFIGARAIDMADELAGLDALILAIDHPIRNRKLGLLFECSVGRGKLLVTGFDLSSNLDARPAAKQLRRSLLAYMRDDAFNPRIDLNPKKLRDRLLEASPNRLSELAVSVRASSTEWYCKAEHLIDGNPDTFWMSQKRGFPQEIVIELQAPTAITGFKHVPLLDGRDNGRIAQYEWYVSSDGEDWGSPVAKGIFERDVREQQVQMDWVNDGFNTTRSKMGKYIRFVALSGWDDDGSSAVTEIDIML